MVEGAQEAGAHAGLQQAVMEACMPIIQGLAKRTQSKNNEILPLTGTSCRWPLSSIAQPVVVVVVCCCCCSGGWSRGGRRAG